jgi:hypothetical protein
MDSSKTGEVIEEGEFEEIRVLEVVVVVVVVMVVLEVGIISSGSSLILVSQTSMDEDEDEVEVEVIVKVEVKGSLFFDIKIEDSLSSSSTSCLIIADEDNVTEGEVDP